MTSPSNPDLLGIQGALILLFDGLSDVDVMDVLDGVLPKELSLWHATDTRAVEHIAINMANNAKQILDKTEDGTGIGTLAVHDIAYQSKALLNYIDRIKIIITSVSKARRSK
ncbi:hypothetical protein UFOVP55_51 [uncultured Caudovirales phage]|uniref:Uncharacterized protein n=1 Tax=uncultured Caudovirales phage TaxID=2100421 RepID=A0A6J5KVP0_9CAUD|nr:hypothetical protein UFOVP55_51 [uncultured Caudovirales phage]